MGLQKRLRTDASASECGGGVSGAEWQMSAPREEARDIDLLALEDSDEDESEETGVGGRAGGGSASESTGGASSDAAGAAAAGYDEAKALELLDWDI